MSACLSNILSLTITPNRSHNIGLGYITMLTHLKFIYSQLIQILDRFHQIAADPRVFNQAMLSSIVDCYSSYPTFSGVLGSSH